MVGTLLIAQATLLKGLLAKNIYIHISSKDGQGRPSEEVICRNICVFAEIFVYLKCICCWLVCVAAFMATLWKEQAGSVAKRWVQLFAPVQGWEAAGGWGLCSLGTFDGHLLASLRCQFTKP